VENTTGYAARPENAVNFAVASIYKINFLEVFSYMCSCV
jgi:hypothetical protein